MTGFDDIYIRKILNIYDYKLYSILSNKPTENRICMSKEPYFFYNNTMICVGYKIKTIDGDYEISVIGYDDIRKKKRIKAELIENNIVEKFIAKRKISIFNCMRQNFKLPDELLENIMKFY